MIVRAARGSLSRKLDFLVDGICRRNVAAQLQTATDRRRRHRRRTGTRLAHRSQPAIRSKATRILALTGLTNARALRGASGYGLYGRSATGWTRLPGFPCRARRRSRPSPRRAAPARACRAAPATWCSRSVDSAMPLPLSCTSSSERVRVHLEHDIDPGRVGMARDVGQHFLKDPEERRRPLLVGLGRLRRQLDLAPDAGALLEFRAPARRWPPPGPPRPAPRAAVPSRSGAPNGSCRRSGRTSISPCSASGFCPAGSRFSEPRQVHLEARSAPGPARRGSRARCASAPPRAPTAGASRAPAGFPPTPAAAPRSCRRSAISRASIVLFR